MFIARIALLPIGLAVAVAAFLHAASETETYFLGPDTYSRLGLDAHVEGELVAGGFAAEMARAQASEPGELPKLSPSLVALARDSFATDPLEVSSLRTIALGGIGQDDEARARRAMRLAQRISKRDSVTNLWLAQDYGRSGDVEAMLTSFDYALRTSERIREFAIKPFVGTLAFEESHVLLGKLLSADPEWEDAFWWEFANNPVSLLHAADFLESASITADRLPDGSRKQLYANLKANRRFEALYRIAARDPRARVDASDLVAGKFVAADEDNPLGWLLRSEGRFAARIHDKSGELQIDAQSGSFGLAADRVVRIAGRQRLVIGMAEPVPDNAALKLTLRCADEASRELATVAVGAEERDGEAVFVADGCPFATVELSFEVEPGRRDALIRIASIALRPA